MGNSKQLPEADIIVYSFLEKDVKERKWLQVSIERTARCWVRQHFHNDVHLNY